MGLIEKTHTQLYFHRCKDQILVERLWTFFLSQHLFTVRKMVLTMIFAMSCYLPLGMESLMFNVWNVV